MSTRSSVRTKNAIYYVENEMMRGLMSVISQVGLSLSPLLDLKETLVTGIVFHLERRTLNAIRLEFQDFRGNTIANGFGLWLFEVNYSSSGNGIIEFPVNKVLSELRRNPYALSAAVVYKITLDVPAGSLLAPGWSRLNTTQNGSGYSTYVASFGYDPLNVSVHRK